MARIIIDARESGTSTGRYIDKLVENLHALKPEHEFTILAKRHRLEFFKQIAPGFKIVRCDIREFSFAEQYSFVWKLYGLKNDLVHFGMPQQPVLYFGPSVTTIHDLTTVRFRNPAKNLVVFSFKQRVYRWVLKRVVRKSLAVISISRYVKDDIVQYAKIDPEKVHVTYEAADKITARPEPLKKLAGQKFIMYVGRAQPHKNLDRLVEAFVAARANHPDLQLVLVGKKDILYQRLEKRIKRQGFEGVVFTGFMEDSQLRWLYEHCQAYVFASLSEGFGLPPLEAMMHGAPVISSTATCLPEIYGNSALYFDPMDTTDMAAKIDRLLDDSKLRQKLIKLGYKQAGKYSWRRMAQQTLEIYNEVILRQGSRRPVLGRYGGRGLRRLIRSLPRNPKPPCALPACRQHSSEPNL
jgi:glycosyltransferase involved in cell wall biosynthesis